MQAPRGHRSTSLLVSPSSVLPAYLLFLPVHLRRHPCRVRDRTLCRGRKQPGDRAGGEPASSVLSACVLLPCSVQLAGVLGPRTGL
jgi:hypothetical protein